MEIPVWAGQHPAKLWKLLHDGHIQCELSPRGCKLSEGQKGFCGVRANISGKMWSLNYGRSVSMVEEVIETEAVNHYMPGTRILSLGNVGCMMDCDFCQNWKTSQVRYLDSDQVVPYSIDRVIETAMQCGIGMLSWTYNDPVVWHEFVMDCARKAKEHGLKNLYKSAFYITETAVSELADVIDVFSISLKSMSEQFYARRTRAHLQPVLDRIKQVVRLGNHLEISNLLVTDLNDSEDAVRQTIRWMRDNCPENTPLHFVRFHPDYRYLEVERTPPERLFRARDIARAEGIKYCYIGNLYEKGVSDTRCPACNHLLVTRFGLRATICGLTAEGHCAACGHPIPIVLGQCGRPIEVMPADARDLGGAQREIEFFWHGDINAVHVVVPHDTAHALLAVSRLPGGVLEQYELGQRAGLSRRLISRGADDELGFHLRVPVDLPVEIYPALDRAHFPICSASQGEPPPKYAHR